MKILLLPPDVHQTPGQMLKLQHHGSQCIDGKIHATQPADFFFECLDKSLEGRGLWAHFGLVFYSSPFYYDLVITSIGNRVQTLYLH